MMGVPPFGLRGDRDAALSVAREVHSEWDDSWPALQESLGNRSLEVLCREGCHGCCFNLKPCYPEEALLIDEYLRREYPEDRQEHFRSRVYSSAGNILKRRREGFAASSDELDRSGGIECPFLDRGRCAIYPARPLSCRSMLFVTSHEAARASDVSLCRKCPASIACLEAQSKRFELQERFQFDPRAESPNGLPARTPPVSIAEMLATLWNDAPPQDGPLVTAAGWQSRLASRHSGFDETWRDDGFDWEVLRFPIVLPEEGEFPPDLVVLTVTPNTHEVYGEHLQTNKPFPLRVLYKLLPGGRFDWQTREFQGEPNRDSHIVWMGDSIQERLMMWEAAKRCEGRVLCGGLGMGIFPQFALSLPQVRSVHVVEMDPAVISLISAQWAKQPWPRRENCSLEQSPIEDFLRETDEKFDTVYIDTWDALTFDYLPHINYLKELAHRTLKPGGEILLWGYDLMVRMALQQAEYMWDRRDEFLQADSSQLEILQARQPLFHKMLRWLLDHPSGPRHAFLTETYRLATTWRKELGRLSLDRLG